MSFETAEITQEGNDGEKNVPINEKRIKAKKEHVLRKNNPSDCKENPTPLCQDQSTSSVDMIL
jgi:hypothetical protein